MGINDRVQNKKEEKRNASQEKRKRRTHSQLGGVGADYGSVDGYIIGKAIAAVARGGGALRLGYTRDGGAYAIGFYEGDDHWTEYVPPNDDIDGFFRGVIEDYEA